MDKLRILFNTEGNNYLGMGHIYECIRLGNKFKEKYNPEILYLLSSDSKPGIKKIQEAGDEIKTVERDDFDSYIERIRKFNPNVVINDILYVKKEYMQRLSSLDSLIVNMEHIKKPESLDYADIIFNSLWPKNFDVKGKYYSGPSYVSLNDSFRDLPTKKINKECKNFFICFGGSDTKGFTLKAIEALNKLNGITAIVLLGSSFNHYKGLEDLLKRVDGSKFIILNDVQDTAPYMLKADIGLVSGGHTINELAATGTPGITLCQNEMEVGRAKLFADYYKMIHNLGDGTKLTTKELLNEIQKFVNNYGLRKKISENGQKLQDGKSSDRVVDIIMENLK